MKSERCTHLLYCSVLSLGGNVNTRRMSKPDMGYIFHIKNQWNILVMGNYYVNYQNYENLMLLTSSDTKRTLMHLFLFTNSAQRELVSLHYNFAHIWTWKVGHKEIIWEILMHAWVGEGEQSLIWAGNFCGGYSKSRLLDLNIHCGHFWFEG